MSYDRLQKIIARAGVASRRKAEVIIAEGRVRVNGQIVRQPGTKADPHLDKIEVDGKRIKLPKNWTYVILNKPQGVVTSAADEFQRKTVLDLLKNIDARVFPVGRLDYDAEGCLLLTNDGDVAAHLTHPAGMVPKVYQAKVKGRPTNEALGKLMEGVILEDGPAKAAHVRRVEVPGPKTSELNAWIQLTVTEGRNHLIKRLFEAIGYPVLRLRRIQFANLNLAGLRPGDYRRLRADELRKIKGVSRAAKGRRNARNKVVDEE